MASEKIRYHKHLNFNAAKLGKVNLETSLAGQRSNPRHAGLCRAAARSARAFI